MPIFLGIDKFCILCDNKAHGGKMDKVIKFVSMVQYFGKYGFAFRDDERIVQALGQNWQGKQIVENINGVEMIANVKLAKQIIDLLKSAMEDKTAANLSLFGGYISEGDRNVTAILGVDGCKDVYLFTEERAYKFSWLYLNNLLDKVTNIYGHHVDTGLKDYAKYEDKNLTTAWHKLLKQNFGANYIQKLIKKAAKRKAEKIEAAREEYNNYTKEISATFVDFNDLDENYNLNNLK